VNVVFASVGFNNTEHVDHYVSQVYSQDDFDSCLSNGNDGWIVNSGDIYDVSV